MQAITPYVLVGGRSSRMGRDKAFLPWQGATLLGHAVARLASFGPARLLSGDPADESRAAQLTPFGELVADRTPGCGPIGGIDAALHDLTTSWALILPIDQPGLPAAELLRWAAQVVGSAALASWLVPPDGAEPLPLLLHRSLAAAAAAALAAGQRRILPAIESIATPFVLPVRVRHPEWFRNLNSPRDLEQFTWRERVD